MSGLLFGMVLSVCTVGSITMLHYLPDQFPPISVHTWSYLCSLSHFTPITHTVIPLFTVSLYPHYTHGHTTVHCLTLPPLHTQSYHCSLSHFTPITHTVIPLFTVSLYPHSLHMLKFSWLHNLSSLSMCCSFATIGHVDMMCSAVSSNCLQSAFAISFEFIIIIIIIIKIITEVEGQKTYLLHTAQSFLRS